MKEVNTAGRIWKVFLYAGIDPLGTVTGNNPDLTAFLFRQGLAEEPEDFKPVAFMDPGDTVTVHVVDDGDV